MTQAMPREAVLDNLRLMAEWLSTGVAQAVQRARGGRRLPDYFNERAARIEVAPDLTILVLGRQALISLKLLAASPSARKHVQDLRALSSTQQELRVAKAFVLKLGSSRPRLEDLELILRELETTS